METARERLIKPDPHPDVHTQYAEFVVTADSPITGLRPRLTPPLFKGIMPPYTSEAFCAH